MLKNPIYVGSIKHKDSVHPGQHEAIVNRAAVWGQVQHPLAVNAASTGKRAVGVRNPLLGGPVDEAGVGLTPSHTDKQGRRYRYYVSRDCVNGRSPQG